MIASTRPHEPPLETADLPGAGGRVGPEPEDFQVDELPLYAPSGAGEHWYVLARKRGKNTQDLVREVARAAGVPDRDVGYAGLKDRHAVTTQWLSVPARAANPASWVLPEGSDVLQVARHGNKLRIGHQRGNRFRIRLVGAEAGAADRGGAIVERLRARGLRNYFGAQRFGRRGENLERALSWLREERPRRLGRFREGLYSSAVQSEVFDRYLTLRAAEGLDHVLDGEVARLDGKSAVFVAERGTEVTPRLAEGAVHATGPMIGPKMLAASGRPHALEREAVRAAGLDERDERALGRWAPGTRRDLLVSLDSLRLTTDGDALLVEVELPSGSYATQVVRELTREPWLDDG